MGWGGAGRGGAHTHLITLDQHPAFAPTVRTQSMATLFRHPHTEAACTDDPRHRVYRGSDFRVYRRTPVHLDPSSVVYGSPFGTTGPRVHFTTVLRPRGHAPATGEQWWTKSGVHAPPCPLRSSYFSVRFCRLRKQSRQVSKVAKAVRRPCSKSLPLRYKSGNRTLFLISMNSSRTA